MKAKTVLKNKEHEDGLHQGKALNGPLDCLPERLLPAIVDRCHSMADHGVAEENNSNGNETIEAEEKAGQDTKESADDSSNDLTAMYWVDGGIDGQDEGKA